MRRLALLLFCILSFQSLALDTDIGVLRVGKSAPYQTIQSAINASSVYQRAIILVDEGLYQEKLFISRNQLAIIGVSAQKTIIKQSILRKHWRSNHDNDWGAAVVNINGSDISLINLTVENDYGRQHNTSEHQFAVRGFANSDRIILKNCRLIADGDDTLSLWNKDGRYYHADCYFSGYTDMVCPRGTALIERSEFFNHAQTATLWHDGELDPDYKLVVSDSQFDGVQGFWLGRRHYDAQFFLLNSTFSERMADKPLFKKRYPQDPDRERPNLYGDRYFFSGNSFPQELEWANDNLRLTDWVPAQYPSLEAWVFDNTWLPSEELQTLRNHLTEISDTGHISTF
ncbi:pectinesterase family protein [Planctobacterium marinum]|uniref:pectinesterase family protein n=1 Tax=Planctobacterium marinum TaxID=1631968 RepID=UPI001E5F2914|nr:pectinesterase family protein [Planctobacterium marinum]MCC2604680.1 pectinesterase family protein [Planctobacterium marinum]